MREITSSCLDITILKEYFKYYPETGFIVWRKKSCIKSRIGAGNFDLMRVERGQLSEEDSEVVAGNRYDGGRKIVFRGKQMKSRRVAWMLYYGEIPNGDVINIDGDVYNDRIENLGVLTRSERMRRLINRTRAEGGIE